MTAAIPAAHYRYRLGSGCGLHAVDLAYQVQLPSSQQVGLSSLKSGEYNNSRVEVAVQSVTVTNRFSF